MAALQGLVAPGQSVADIGANVGVYTKELSRLVGARGTVYAFEPLDENYEILERVIRKSNLANVRSFRLALGASAGRREMVIPNLGGFTGYYWAHFAGAGDGGRRHMVTVATLDELCSSRRIEGVEFIKCDVEGGEVEVVRGGLDLIRSRRPAWLLEVSRGASEEIFRTFHQLRYEAFVFDGHLIRTPGYRDGEFSNYFFLHPDSAAGRHAQRHGRP